ncbi:PREDICTED: uncharacterized protein LOC105453205 isoform X1 [Wasmannia auropunctata]|uniref:uncharacterized protein LOC105453205 isoform X1 n=1 Tax=Wasmannia auropunctata TaxID=64793 RepID=UPI0005EEE76F|nr:PREDICTED: uncharacterized protein LOC105453205 isoform X1 [Wasmannia auropunctata]
MIPERVCKYGRDKNNQIRARRRSVSPFRNSLYVQYGFLSGKPLQRGASVAHQPSASRYRTTAQPSGERVPRRDAARRSAIPRCFRQWLIRECAVRSTFVVFLAERSSRILASRKEREETPQPPPSPSPLVPSARFRPPRDENVD